MSTDVIEIPVEDMDALIERMENNLADGLSPEPSDVLLILKILRQFATMQQKLESSSYLKTRYLKLMGLVKSSEDRGTLFDKKSPSKDKPPRKKKAKAAEVPPTTCHHTLEDVEKGQRCPECGEGILNKTEPASFIRITGQAPLTAENHIMEQLRCRLCDAMFTAKLPENILADGARQQKYGYSARTIMAISKFYMGNPYYRQDSLQSLLGVPVTASTIYDQCVWLVSYIEPVFDHLKTYAADAPFFNIDDTGNKILSETSIEKPNRNGKGTRKRTGVYSSCLIARWDNGREIVLFKTNIGHSGEWIDEILSERTTGLPKPKVMSDALPSNKPKSVTSETILCNSHGRRKFTDVVTNYPNEVELATNIYANIWRNETHIEKEAMSPDERLAYHREHSLLHMEKLLTWCEENLHGNKIIEENSGLGRAMKYFIKHYKGLTAFCYIEGAQIDNNLAERVIKIIVRGRKNALFYKTLKGAHVGDVITSMIASCELNGVNSFDYLTVLQQQRREVEINPEYWLPWNYQETLKKIQIEAT